MSAAVVVSNRRLTHSTYYRESVMAKRKEETLVHGGPIVSMEIVDRPLSTKHQWPITEEVKAIAHTVETGRAVQLAFRTGEEMKCIQMALRHAVSKAGLKMHYSKGVGERIVAWAEKVGESKS